MTFAEVIGQHKTKEDLSQMLRSDRLPHALLLLGTPGCGHLSLALAFAQYVLCEDRSADDACGRCRHCLKASKLIHPDLHFSFPTVGTNVLSDHFLAEWRGAMSENPYLEINDWLQRIAAENKQGNINKEECLNIIKKLSLKTFESNYKVLIMWLPEYLGKEGNRLLKLIEEPPDNTVFILVAERQELILNTILSRCQLVQVPPLDDDSIVAGLMEREGLSEEKAKGIARLADGNFNEARTLTRQEENDQAQLLLDWLRRCYRGNGVEMVDWVENFAGIGRENQKHFLRYALHFLRELTLMKAMSGQAGYETRVRLPAGELETARRLSGVVEIDQLELLTELLTETTYYVERNANPKILFLDVSIRMNQIFKRRQASLQPRDIVKLEERTSLGMWKHVLN
jgi:DNA polymerase-3 subunit delta'